MNDEPMYDDDAFECMAIDNRKDLVSSLWSYILSLEDYVVQLRMRVNSLSIGRKPYPDPASDFALRFSDHPGYQEFSDILDVEDCFESISD